MTAPASPAARPAPSLMRRIIVRLSLITAAASVLAYAWLEYDALDTVRSLRNTGLESIAETIAASLKPGPDGALSPASLAPFANPGHGDEYHYAVRRTDGRTLLAKGGPFGPLPKSGTDGESVIYSYDPDGPGPANYVGVALPRVINGDTYWVQVEHANDDYKSLVKSISVDFFDDGGWTMIPLLLALLGSSILTIRGTLAPLDRLSHLAATIRPEMIDVRLPEDDVPREILPLVRAFNSALGRLDEGYRLQREFTADTAHELRTPLAVLRAQLDLLPPTLQTGAMRSGVDTMTRLVSQMLNAARVEQLSIDERDVVDLHNLALDIASYLGPVAIVAGKEIEVAGSDRAEFVRGHAEALFDALRNLVENALTHSEPGGIVTVFVAPREIRVIDRGAGIPPAQRVHLFSRFWRANPSKSGAGLGLSIVKKIADAHRAAVSVEETPGGGATFRLVFPAETKHPTV